MSAQAPDPSRQVPDSRVVNPLTLLDALAQAVSQWCRRRPAWLFATLVIVVSLVRWGATIRPVFHPLFTDAARAFPEPSGWLDSSLGTILAMRLLDYPSMGVWIALGIAGFAGMLAYIIHLARRSGPWWRETLLLIVLSTPFGMLTHMIGHYDYLTIIGSTLAACARRLPFMVAGSCLAVLGNPEQVFLATIALGLVSVAYPSLRVRAAILGSAAAVCLCALSLVYGAGSSRLTAVGSDEFRWTGIRRFLADPTLSVWAFFGPVWIVVALIVWRLGRRDALAVVAGVILVPAVTSILTIDGTRVFAAIACAPLVGVIGETWRREWSSAPPPKALLGALALILVCTPGVNLFPTVHGLLFQPWNQFFTWIVHWPMTPEKFVR